MMLYEERFVAFVDILGFAALVESLDSRERPFEHIWFNQDGEIAVTELMKTMGISGQNKQL